MRRAFLGVALASVGCASKPPPPPVMEMPPAVIEAPRMVTTQRTPSKDIAVRFPYAANEEVTSLAYSDLTLLAKPELAQSLAAAVADWANTTAGVDRPCVDAIVGSAKEFLLGGGQRGWVAVVRLPDHKLETVCTPSPRLATEAPLEGATKAWTFKDEDQGLACATTPGWLACGSTEMVKLALAATGDGLVPVGLEGDEVLTVDTRNATHDLRFVAASTPERLTARLELTYDNDDEARKIHERFERPTEVAPAVAEEYKATPEQQRFIARIARNLVASHRAARASIRVELEEPFEAQARDAGELTRLVTDGVRRARARARTDEARKSLDQISSNLAEAWKANESTFAGRTKLVSFPAVPATVPKGERVTTPSESWKPWTPLRWTLASPTYFQFEIVAAKDGQSADIVAHGDLDGNGKTSTFTRHVSVDKSSKTLKFDDVTATDPDE